MRAPGTSPGRASVLDARSASLRHAEKSQIQVDNANDDEGNEDPSEEKHIQNVNSFPTEIFVPPEKVVEPCHHVFIALPQPMPDQLYGYICHADQSAPKPAKNRRDQDYHISPVLPGHVTQPQIYLEQPGYRSFHPVSGDSRSTPNVKAANLALDTNVIQTPGIL